MKFKSLGVLFFSTFLTIGLASCGGHEHTIKEGRKNDATSHWHECEECDEQLDKENHTFTAWTITKEPTCTETGSKFKECSVCKYKVEEVIPELGHEYKEVWTFDDNNHWHECEHDKSHKKDVEPHIYGDWIEVKAPTCLETGLKEKVCKCGHKVSEIIPALGHDYKDTYTFDDNNHWHECTHDSNHKKDVEAHIYGDWVEVKKPTCEEKGLKEKTCKCGHKITEEIPALKHKYQGFSVSKIVLSEENPVKVDAFCGNDAEHKLQFELPSINSNSYKLVTNYNGSCLKNGFENHYELINNEANKLYLKSFTDTLSNPSDFYRDIFSAYLSKTEVKDLTKHNKLSKYEVIEEPTLDKPGKIELYCECGEKVIADLPTLFLTNYEITYPTPENPNTIFKAKGFDLTKTCSENFLEYSDILNKLKNTEFVYEVLQKPELEMFVNKFSPGLNTELKFRFKGHSLSYVLEYACFASEPTKFIEKLTLKDNETGLGKVATNSIFVDYESLLPYLDNLPNIKNYPELETMVKNTSIKNYENQTVEQVEHLLQPLEFNNFEVLVEPTPTTTGKIVLKSFENINEEYILPVLTDQYYKKSEVLDCNQEHIEYYSIKPEVIREILAFSMVRNSADSINTIASYKYDYKDAAKYGHTLSDNIKIVTQPSRESTGTIEINCGKCRVSKTYNIPAFRDVIYTFDSSKLDTAHFSETGLNTVLQQITNDFVVTEESKTILRNIEFTVLEPVVERTTSLIHKNGEQTEIIFESEYSRKELGRTTFTYNEALTPDYKIEYGNVPNRPCKFRKFLKLSTNSIQRILGNMTENDISSRLATTFKDLIIGELEFTPEEEKAHRTVPHTFFLQTLEMLDDFEVEYQFTDSSCGFSKSSFLNKNEYFGDNNKVDIRKMAESIANQSYNTIEADIINIMDHINKYLERYPNNRLHYYL